MSVRNETYLIYGVNLHNLHKSIINEDFLESDRWETLKVPWGGKDAKGKMGVLYDGMAGQYVLAGLVLAVGNDEEGIELTILDPDEIILQNSLKVKDWLWDSFELSTSNLKLFLVTHYH